MSRTNFARDDAPADRLAGRLDDALRRLARALPDGARDLALVRGIAPGGTFTRPLEAVLADLRRVFVPPDGPFRVFGYGTSVVMEMTTDGSEPALVTLCVGVRVESSAGGCLANLLVCVLEKPDGPPLQFPLPRQALAVVLAAEPLLAALPRIELYVRRPVYSHDFVLLGPGYHRRYQVLVHGPAVEPDLTPLPAGADAFARLPRHLRALLAGFCFSGAADLVNYVGLLLTGLLVHHFVVPSKAVALIDGNQPGLGKSLLVELLGLILDGVLPPFIHYTASDEEVGKRVCTNLRSGRHSVLAVDNAKTESGAAVSSPALEANAVAPVIALRILGVSENLVRPNDVLWAITMNHTSVSPDLMSLGLPIRLRYDGPPDKRTFPGPDPVEYAREHRLDLLGELAGMVERWKEAGRPDGPRSHRCHVWARVVGGVLAANGFTEFLSNYDEAAGEFDTANDDLIALLYAAATQVDGPVAFSTELPASGNRTARNPWPASLWANLFDRAGVKYAAGEVALGDHGRAVQAGKWLTGRLKREVPVRLYGSPATAHLELVTARANEKKYQFVVTFADDTDRPAGGPPPVAVPPEAVPVTVPDAPPAGNAERW